MFFIWLCPSINIAGTDISTLSAVNVRFLEWYSPLPEAAENKNKKKKTRETYNAFNVNTWNKSVATLNRAFSVFPQASVSQRSLVRSYWYEKDSLFSCK